MELKGQLGGKITEIHQKATGAWQENQAAALARAARSQEIETHREEWSTPFRIISRLVANAAEEIIGGRSSSLQSADGQSRELFCPTEYHRSVILKLEDVSMGDRPIPARLHVSWDESAPGPATKREEIKIFNLTLMFGEGQTTTFGPQADLESPDKTRPLENCNLFDVPDEPTSVYFVNPLEGEKLELFKAAIEEAGRLN